MSPLNFPLEPHGHPLLLHLCAGACGIDSPMTLQICICFLVCGQDIEGRRVRSRVGGTPARQEALEVCKDIVDMPCVVQSDDLSMYRDQR